MKQEPSKHVSNNELLANLLNKFKGTWVATTPDEKVISIGNSSKEVYRLAKEKGFKNITVTCFNTVTPGLKKDLNSKTG